MGILSFKNQWLEEFYENDDCGKKIPNQISDVLFLALQKVDISTNLKDLRSPPGNHLKELSGNLKGKHAIRVNKQYRLIFTWDKELGGARDLYLDPHTYR